MPKKAKGKGRGKGKKGKRKTPPPASPPPPEIIRPNVYEILDRRLKREKQVRTAAWLLYTNVPAYIKAAGLEDPPVKNKKLPKVVPKTEVPAAELSPFGVISVPNLVPSPVKLDANGNPIYTPEELAKKRAMQFQINIKEFALTPEEEHWIAGEHLGDTDEGSESGSVRMYLTDYEELHKIKEATVPWMKRREQRRQIMGESRVSKSSVLGDASSRVNKLIAKLSGANLAPGSALNPAATTGGAVEKGATMEPDATGGGAASVLAPTKMVQSSISAANTTK